MQYSTIVLEFQKATIEDFNDIKEIVGNNRNRFLEALLIVSFDNIMKSKDFTAVFSVMSSLETQKMMAQLAEHKNGSKKKPTPPRDIKPESK